MHFVLVNHRTPRGGSDCACCHAQLDLGYLREMSSLHVFCDVRCYERYRKTFGPAGSATRATAPPVDLGSLFVDWITPTGAR
jgi:hypothetical protein